MIGWGVGHFYFLLETNKKVKNTKLQINFSQEEFRNIYKKNIDIDNLFLARSS